MAFRGTEPKKLRDWHTDAKVKKESGPAGKVHRGFKKALQDVWIDRNGKPGVRNSIDEFRFINNNDLVTRVPPRKFKYSHVGRVLYIDSTGRLHNDIAWWNKFLDRVKGVLKDIGNLGPDTINDECGPAAVTGGRWH